MDDNDVAFKAWNSRSELSNHLAVRKDKGSKVFSVGFEKEGISNYYTIE